MLLFSFCTCHWLLPWLLSGLLGTLLGWLIKPNKQKTVVEEKIVYKDKIVYQDKIVYKERPSDIVKVAKIVSKPIEKKEVSTSDKVKDKTEKKAILPKPKPLKIKEEVKDIPIPFVAPKEVSAPKKVDKIIDKVEIPTKKVDPIKVPKPAKTETPKIVAEVIPQAVVAPKVSAIIDTPKIEEIAKVKETAKPVEKKSIYASFKSDNLQIVEGIGPKMDEVLKKHGVHTWKELSANSKEDLRAILDKENPTRYRIIDPTTWSEQARLAHTGKWEDLVTYQKRLDTGRTDVGDGVTDSKVEKLLVKMGVLKKWKKDDLKAIEGIGPKISELLNKAGIKSWKALSKASVDELKKVLEKAGSRYKLADPGSWPKQAEFAAAGKWDELQEYQDFLVGGK